MTLAGESDRSYSATAEPPALSPARPTPVVKYTADGSIDEDIFCVHCGYNLRGLSGDPVRCPECGCDNELASVVVSAELIRKAWRDLETCPTACVALTVTFVLLASVAAAVSVVALGMAALLIALGMFVWRSTYRRFVITVGDAKPARHIVLRFHLATLLCTGPIPCLLVMEHIYGDESLRVPDSLALAVIAGTIVLIPLGLKLYGNVQRDTIRAQREAAVRIARDRLRKALTTRRRGIVLR